jgi:hypothetical protein
MTARTNGILCYVVFAICLGCLIEASAHHRWLRVLGILPGILFSVMALRTNAANREIEEEIMRIREG